VANPAPKLAPRGLIRTWLARKWLVHGRLYGAMLVGLIAFFLQSDAAGLPTRLLLAWNVAMFVYLLLILGLTRRSNTQMMQTRAALYDEDDFTFLILMIIAAAGSFATIIVELAAAGRPGPWPLAMAVFCILLTWTFTHVLFGLHYAHGYYSLDEQGQIKGGLLFPEKPAKPTHPHYLDFFYFSFVIGCATATADISITSRAMRRLALLHGIVAFAFNTTILALTINLAAGRLTG
jgi:uncharacterized membrane protein